jgi:Raf kinase inhibitor-like YbhB/YbcL family protein
MSLVLESPAFSANEPIPVEYTCKGTDHSPALSWHGAPAGTKSFALIMDDPDAPGGTWDHWVLFNIPATLNELKASARLPAGATSGKNTWGNQGYGGPCPPSGTHRYFFTLYALDTQLSLDSAANKQDVSHAMKGHILDKAELIGLFGV